MHRFASALATVALAFLFHVESAVGEPAVLIPITLTPTNVTLTHCESLSCPAPISITGVDRAEQHGAVAEIVDNYFQLQTGPEGISTAKAEFEFAIPNDVPLGSSVIINRTQSSPFGWTSSVGQAESPSIARVTSTLLNATQTVPLGVRDTDTVPGPAYPGDIVKYVVELTKSCVYGTICAGRPNQSVRLDFHLLTTGAAGASLACKADLTGDGVVNFADLAKMKSVFFKSCTP